MFNLPIFRLLIIFAFLLCIKSYSFASTYSEDSLVVRQILDTNGHKNISVNDVTTASEGRIVSLDLSNKPLGRFVFTITVLPSKIGYLTGLKILELGTNQLTVIPAEICSLTALTGLSF